jgi:Domain of unknown function (DUF4148)
MTNLSSCCWCKDSWVNDSSLRRAALLDSGPPTSPIVLSQEFIMKVRTSFFAASALVLLAAAPAVYAQEATPDTWIGASHSTLSRAEVRAQAIAARDAGLIQHGEASVEPLAPRSAALLAQAKTRAQVRAETAEARKLGLVTSRGDSSDVVEITPRQAEQIRVAGLRARDAEQRQLAQGPGAPLVN